MGLHQEEPCKGLCQEKPCKKTRKDRMTTQIGINHKGFRSESCQAWNMSRSVVPGGASDGQTSGMAAKVENEKVPNESKRDQEIHSKRKAHSCGHSDDNFCMLMIEMDFR